MAIKFEITVKQFGKKKGKKAPPKAVYKGDVTIEKRDDVIDVSIKGKKNGKKKDLPIRIRWDSHADQLMCLANFDKEKKVRFMLKTSIPGKGDISGFSVGGQDSLSGKFIHWSAGIVISEKK